MILKGQNLRVMTMSGNDKKCIAMATSCTITLTNNTEDASHKDVASMAQMPVMTSQSWSVSVDSLDVSDTAALLTAIKDFQEFTLYWDETTTSNQQAEEADFARKGTALLTDATFTFNDRTNSTKNIQFTGISEINPDVTGRTEQVSANAFTKGQFVRLFLSRDNTALPASVIAAAKTLSLHVSVQLEDATTKDTTGHFQVQEPTGLSYDISTSALVRGGDTISSTVASQYLNDFELIHSNGVPVKWLIANVSGANNRTRLTTICSGSALLTQLTINAQNRQSATYDAQLQGYGPYVVGA